MRSTFFSRIPRRGLNAQKFDASENLNHNRTNRIKWYVREKIQPCEYAS